jgi:transposase-like protein
MARSRDSVEEVMGRLRWTAEDARRVLAAVDASGSSPAAFAAQHGVQVQRLQAWRRKLARDTPAKPALSFVEMASSPVGVSGARSRYEVVLTTGEVLRIEGPIEPDVVRTLLALLRAPAPC